MKGSYRDRTTQDYFALFDGHGGRYEKKPWKTKQNKTKKKRKEGELALHQLCYLFIVSSALSYLSPFVFFLSLSPVLFLLFSFSRSFFSHSLCLFLPYSFLPTLSSSVSLLLLFIWLFLLSFSFSVFLYFVYSLLR